MVHEARIRHLIGAPPRQGSYVLYWMQQAQRTEYNHALYFASRAADELGLPLVVGFVLTPDFPEANLRHYQFMIEGIEDVEQSLEKADIPLLVHPGEMLPSVLKLSEKAAWVVTDMGYSSIQRRWRREAGKALSCPFTTVETDVVVPVETASGKEETAARTLRPKLLKQKDEFLDSVPVPRGRGAPDSLPEGVGRGADLNRLLAELKIDRSVAPVSGMKGGEKAAKIRLNRFICEALADYEKLGRDPSAQCRSGMSPYFHFGQISPLTVYREVSGSEAPDFSKWAYLEQLLVRRELGINFAWYNPECGSYEKAVPEWARKSLKEHMKDKRSCIYSKKELEQAETHDKYWNAAQTEMTAAGSMHGYMRMYWGKKIIEWSKSPEEAFDTMLYLNNKYEIDGRDPCSYAGAAWCFGRHDRPFKERPVTGRIRFMNSRGLERKFRIGDYVRRVMGIAV